MSTKSKTILIENVAIIKYIFFFQFTWNISLINI